jgi:chromosomal replication initiator protein
LRSPQEIWEAALGELQTQVTRANFNTWLKDTIGVRHRDKIFVIGAPNTFVAEWLENRLKSLIKKTLTSIIGNPVVIEFMVTSTVNCQAKPAVQPTYADGGTSSKASKLTAETNLNSRYTFSNFISGECNRLAYAASLEVVENPGHVYNPLFIYGDTGLGKTHLLLAVGHAARSAGHRVLYTSAEQLTSEFVFALKSNNTDNFHSRYRNADFLLVDDFQFLSGKVQTQECFYHIFNERYENNCQIVVTSDCAPAAIGSLEKRLRSRMQGGLIADLKSPDVETRLTILKTKAKLAKISIAPAVLQLMATQFCHNVRELEGGLNRVITYARLSGAELDIKTATQALADLIVRDIRKDSSLAPERIIDVVAGHYELSAEALVGKRRDRKTSLARHMAMYLMRDQNNYPFSEIGKIFGNRDHTTVLHGCEKIAGEASINPQTAKSINELKKLLGIKTNP